MLALLFPEASFLQLLSGLIACLLWKSLKG